MADEDVMPPTRQKSPRSSRHGCSGRSCIAQWPGAGCSPPAETRWPPGCRASLISSISVAENIALQAPPSRRDLIDREATTALAPRCLAELTLDIDPHQSVHELSFVQQKLMEIAKAIFTESRRPLGRPQKCRVAPPEGRAAAA
ncbi:hypothetical protein [Streptomyces sp. NBC_00063]|uniref:hypothetical protein n=1 Tax=Streptomyces sp. NBC_00063 TaxID=2975638 RepID=UPI003D7043BD